MMFTKRDKASIRALIYAIQFESSPVNGIERVMQLIRDGKILEVTPENLLKTIQVALFSEYQLANLLPQPHSEELIREFLREIERRLN